MPPTLERLFGMIEARMGLDLSFIMAMAGGSLQSITDEQAREYVGVLRDLLDETLQYAPIDAEYQVLD